MKKADVLALLDDMPEEIDVQKLMYTLYVRRKIELSDAAAEAGEEISHEELIRQSDEWHD